MALGRAALRLQRPGAARAGHAGAASAAGQGGTARRGCRSGATASRPSTWATWPRSGSATSSARRLRLVRFDPDQRGCPTRAGRGGIEGRDGLRRRLPAAGHQHRLAGGAEPPAGCAAAAPPVTCALPSEHRAATALDAHDEDHVRELHDRHRRRARCACGWSSPACAARSPTSTRPAASRATSVRRHAGQLPRRSAHERRHHFRHERRGGRRHRAVLRVGQTAAASCRSDAGLLTLGGRRPGSGMNRSRPAPGRSAARAQSSAACAMRSLRLETKFQPVWRWPSGSPPISTTRASAAGRDTGSSPAASTSIVQRRTGLPSS